MAGSNGKQSAYYWNDETLILSISVQPGASRNTLVGIHGQHIKVRLTAPPVEGKANQSLKKQLAKWFKVPAAQVSIRTGLTSKRKIVHIKQPRCLPDFIETP
ncbi:DUF167 domain-containing protein [Kaarinaea lacus]